MRILSTLLFPLLIASQALLADIEVTARFNPPRIAMGDTAQYIVEIVETSSTSQPQVERITSLPIPEASGLTLRNGRTSSSQQTRFINGAAEYSVTQSLIIDATPPRVGSYTIPAYTLVYKGQRLSAPAATLQVLERSADAGPTTDEMIFLKADLPESLYVGQTSRVELKLYIAEGVRLSGLNSFDRSADGFTISELPDNSDESVELYQGRRYRVLTWPMTLTPIQTGEQKISFQFGLTAQLPNQERRRDPFGRSPFGGSLFEDFFGRSERLNIYTDEAAIDVLPLPDPQPNSFTGAIGQFAIEVGTDAEATTQGEPIMLSVIITGDGNFERINGPSYPNNPDWRSYDPEEKFEARDELGLSGSKRFDYLFIPQRAGTLQLPPTEFSYYDPNTAAYVELSAPPIQLEVSAAQNNFAPPPSAALPQNSESEIELSRPLTTEEALLTLDYRPRPARNVGTAILTHPVFIALNAFAALTLIGATLALTKLKRNREDPAYPLRKAAKEALKQDRQAYLDAHRRNDADAFYKAAQSAIRNAATIHTSQPMHSAGSPQIATLLPPDSAATCHQFFAAADAHRFGHSSTADLSQTKQQVETILKAL